MESKNVIIKCVSSGDLACSTTYNENEQPFKFMKPHPNDFTLVPAPRATLNPYKVAYVKSLLPFISEENRTFYINLFEEGDVTEN